MPANVRMPVTWAVFSCLSTPTFQTQKDILASETLVRTEKLAGPCGQVVNSWEELFDRS